MRRSAGIGLDRVQSDTIRYDTIREEAVWVYVRELCGGVGGGVAVRGTRGGVIVMKRRTRTTSRRWSRVMKDVVVANEMKKGNPSKEENSHLLREWQRGKCECKVVTKAGCKPQPKSRKQVHMLQTARCLKPRAHPQLRTSNAPRMASDYTINAQRVARRPLLLAKRLSHDYVLRGCTPSTARFLPSPRARLRCAGVLLRW